MIDTMLEIDKIIFKTAQNLSQYNNVYNIVNNENNYINIGEKTINMFNELSLSHGIPALCMLYGELNEQYPNKGWDLIGHEYIIKIGQLLEEKGVNSISMFSGASGIGLSAICLSHNKTRYTSFINNLNNFLKQTVPNIINILISKDSLSMSDYDIIEGLCGVANYCMLFKEDTEIMNILNSIVKYILHCCNDKELDKLYIPGWYISKENQFLEQDKKYWPNGCFNMGLSHGVPGMLLTLCNATKCGIKLTGQNELIIKLSEFLMKFKVISKNGTWWPSHISLEEYIDGKVKTHNTRDAWCYGTPGVAYSLLISGNYLNEEKYIKTSISAMNEALIRKTNIYSPTFCHGFAGLAYISHRFFEITNQQEFKIHSLKLIEKILETYDSHYPFGFKDIDINATEKKYYTNIGLIDGTVGVLLTLLAIQKGKKTSWDFAFSLQ